MLERVACMFDDVFQHFMLEECLMSIEHFVLHTTNVEACSLAKTNHS